MKAVMREEPPAELVVDLDHPTGFRKTTAHGEQRGHALTYPSTSVGIADPPLEVQGGLGGPNGLLIPPRGELAQPPGLARVDPKRRVAQPLGQCFRLLHRPLGPI